MTPLLQWKVARGDSVRNVNCNCKRRIPEWDIYKYLLQEIVKYQKEAAARKGKQVSSMKKIIALLTAVMILAGSFGMVTLAAVDPNTCIHPDDNILTILYDSRYSTTSTHPVWVANKPNGEPILATCTLTVIWQKCKVICGSCQHVFSDGPVKISETHSMHH